MDSEIGAAAGKVWSYLSQNGSVRTAKMIRELDCTRDMTQRAIGWLARENKIVLGEDERAETISLHR